MASFLPQGMLHTMRGTVADGAGIRNRSGEQRLGYTGGNPNMPLYNNAVRGYTGRPRSTGFANAVMPQFGQGQYGTFAGMLSGGAPMQSGAIASGPQTMLAGPMPSKPMQIAGPQAEPAYGNGAGPRPSWEPNAAGWIIGDRPRAGMGPFQRPPASPTMPTFAPSRPGAVQGSMTALPQFRRGNGY